MLYDELSNINMIKTKLDITTENDKVIFRKTLTGGHYFLVSLI